MAQGRIARTFRLLPDVAAALKEVEQDGRTQTDVVDRALRIELDLPDPAVRDASDAADRPVSATA